MRLSTEVTPDKNAASTDHIQRDYIAVEYKLTIYSERLVLESKNLF